MIIGNLALAFAVALGLKALFLLSGFSFWECLTAYALCGALSVLAFSWATFARTPVRADQ